MTAGEPDAQTREETQADGIETFGRVNQHPSDTEGDGVGVGSGFKVGVSVDRNKKCRRTMEDAHSFIYDFGGIRGQGFFSVFDGHAGKHAAEWCGEHFHEHLLTTLLHSPSAPVPDLLNSTFHTVDAKLSELSASQNQHSGCTAVVAFLRLEDNQGRAVGEASGVGRGAVRITENDRSPQGDKEVSTAEGPKEEEEQSAAANDASRASDVKSRIRDLLSGSSRSTDLTDEPKGAGVTGTGGRGGVATPNVEITGPAEVKQAAKRTLYVGNVGDARAVLARGGRPVRLSYDHKGSDAKEVKRITDAGGFVLNNRVNGVLAVTRALGDSSMKEFVVGAPYTTETTLGPEDDFLIVACDGLWDVCTDQEAVDLIKGCTDPQEASQKLLDHALSNFSTDNLSVLVVSLQPQPRKP
ncbi:SPOSA6832_04878 [Sporobolomyces salmonicolor]|uniref:SPOSA6832_04878-mRNA-1:cds n=1 Tax=Sporidiobolus salmonicolor TaxID=5005 RepID=A0A0D6ET38_SPOSA|nr:SPOSA6832_04878 [Sporobolomyces salmonicolor]